MKFVETLMETIDSTYEKGEIYPNTKEQRDGALPKETFQFYLWQKGLFLTEYKRALSMVAARAKKWEHLQVLSEISNEIHRTHKHLNDAIQDKDSKKTWACSTYADYLISTSATKSFNECLATLLPFMLYYSKLGKQTMGNQGMHKALEHLIKSYVDIFNALAKDAEPEEKKKMTDSYATSTKLQYLFLDSCYHEKSA